MHDHTSLKNSASNPPLYSNSLPYNESIFHFTFVQSEKYDYQQIITHVELSNNTFYEILSIVLLFLYIIVILLDAT